MDKRHLGDSYDLVKGHLLRSLRELGSWAAHPMVTGEPFGPSQKEIYGALLGVPILSLGVLTTRSNRQGYFSVCGSRKGHLFLDPTTGFKLGSGNSEFHLFSEDLRHIAGADSLIMIFDQSHSRADSEGIRKNLCRKLSGLQPDFYGLAYQSHACLLFLSRDHRLVSETSVLLRKKAHIPADRLVAPF